MQEGETVVIILEIKGCAHPGRKLIHEAKDTAILTGVLLIHQGCFKLQPNVVVFSLGDADGIKLVLAQKRELDQVLGQIEAIIKHVMDIVAVDRYQYVAGFNSDGICLAMWLDCCNFDHFRTSFFEKFDKIPL